MKEREGSAKKYRDQTLPCEERQRLENAYQLAKREEEAAADEAYKEAIRHNGGRPPRAINNPPAGGSRAAHLLEELRLHQLQHDCVPRVWPGRSDD